MEPNDLLDLDDVDLFSRLHAFAYNPCSIVPNPYVDQTQLKETTTSPYRRHTISLPVHPMDFIIQEVESPCVHPMLLHPPSFTSSFIEEPITPKSPKRKKQKRKIALEPLDVGRRTQVKIACIHCKKACKKCDESRPCSRCVRLGLSDSCHDAPRKERKKSRRRDENSSFEDSDAELVNAVSLPSLSHSDL